jgi:hypothetical protein
MTAQVVALYGSHSEMLHFLSLSPEIEGDTYYIYKMSWPYEMTMSTLKSAKKTNSRFFVSITDLLYSRSAHLEETPLSCGRKSFTTLNSNNSTSRSW